MRPGAACKAEPEDGDPEWCQQQQLLADVQNPGHQPGSFQRVAQGARFAQREGPVVQGTGLHGKEKKGKLRRASRLVEPPTADPHGGWCGGRRLEAVAYPISHCLRSTRGQTLQAKAAFA